MKCALYALLGVCALLAGVRGEACLTDNCQAPDCRCSSTGIPGGLSAGDTPQMVVLTFDGALTSLYWNSYYQPLIQDRQNPNGCPFRVTFFVTHDYSNYTLANQVYNEGHEIAARSVSNNNTVAYWTHLDTEGLQNEFEGARAIISTFANIPATDIKGARIPILQLPGNPYFKILQDLGFEYDSSWPTRTFMNPGLWPYTLDYESLQECPIGECPTDSFPGLWEAPLVNWNSTGGIPCSTILGCITANQTEDDFYNLILDNFNVQYNGNRAPFGLYVDPAWLFTPEHSSAASKFLDYLMSLEDVYVVTMAQAIEWVRNPTASSNIADFAPWSCGDLPTAACPNTNNCRYQSSPDGSERTMPTCTTCPNHYPWLGDPYGNITSVLYA